MKKLIPILLVVIGAILMTAQIITESEPGAIPLALIALGFLSYFILRRRDRSRL